MKFPSILLLLVVFFYGCTSSSSDIEPEEIIAQDPKCLVSTQWGNDFSKPTEFPSSHWMRDPEMYFNSLNAGFFSLD